MSAKTRKRKRRRSISKARYLLRLTLLVLVCVALLWGVFYLITRPKSADKPDDLTSKASSSAASSSLSSSTTPSPVSSSSTTASSSSSTKSKTTRSSTSKTSGTTSAPINTAGHYVQKSGAPWNLLLVNAWNPIEKSFEDSIAMSEYRSSGKHFDNRAIDELRRMIKDAGSRNLYAVSLYRSRASQDKLFKRKIQRLKNSGYTGSDIEAKAATAVARPGTSEHQTGLAADILGSGYSTLTSGFDKTEAFRWLKEHCAEYGFILRYPKEKQSITGVIYEPWHYRYVGKEHAAAIMKQGICLEEYLEQIGG